MSTDKIGLIIKSLRKKNNWTQEELGKKIGVKHNTVASYEYGSNKPSIEVLVTLSQIFDLSIDELVGNPHKESITVEWKEVVEDLIHNDYTPERIRKAIRLVESLEDVLNR